MRFFTDQFFTEEQKRQMLGAAYPKHLEQRRLREQERQADVYAAKQRSLQQQAELKEFERSSRATEIGFFIFILLLSLVNWLTTPYALNGLV